MQSNKAKEESKTESQPNKLQLFIDALNKKKPSPPDAIKQPSKSSDHTNDIQKLNQDIWNIKNKAKVMQAEKADEFQKDSTNLSRKYEERQRQMSIISFQPQILNDKQTKLSDEVPKSG